MRHAARGRAAGRESRRKVSILFMDIVGSTTLAERMDPEALRQIMDSYFAVCVRAVCMVPSGSDCVAGVGMVASPVLSVPALPASASRN